MIFYFDLDLPYIFMNFQHVNKTNMKGDMLYDCKS